MTTKAKPKKPPKPVILPETVDVLLDRDQVALAIGVSLRSFTEMRSTGEFPEPDMTVTGHESPRWRVSTFNAWRQQQGAK